MTLRKKIIFKKRERKDEKGQRFDKEKDMANANPIKRMKSKSQMGPLLLLLLLTRFKVK